MKNGEIGRSSRTSTVGRRTEQGAYINLHLITYRKGELIRICTANRCRKLYEKYLEWLPENCYAWSKFAELERSLYETERARAVFELAIDQPALDIPELLWKAYIDFEISEGEFERTRALYERLLNRSKHLKVWISYAKFEALTIDDSDIKQKNKCLQHARDVFERAVSYLINSAPELKEERTWIYMESNFGELGNANLVRAKLPRKLKKRRQIETEDGPAAYEEYIDYLFPEANNLNILASAYKWKKQRIATKDLPDSVLAIDFFYCFSVISHNSSFL
ncbi:hypothetical protein KY290_022957 [Solanum tuberosum]|uniref:Crooked neck protein n=1 Tax=Solanum tuberosum TaxID=4113 RepID=A0ABQ7V5X2_SOLTU|nr:hypothetical protein KY290_022957 [Solanum tuberosum]